MSWIGHRLVPRLLSHSQYVYEEKDELNSIYFVSAGELAFCLANKGNAVFYKVKIGYMLGLEDYAHYIKM